MCIRDSTWLTNYFEVDFKPFHKKGAPDLYPEELRKDIDEMNDWLFDNINNCLLYTSLGGGLDDENKWKETGGKFFLPYGVISKVFRGKYLDELKKMCIRDRYKVNLNLTSTKFIFHKKNMTGFFLKKQSYFYSNI